MEDIWRKAKYFGLGLVDFTKEKVEALVGEMVKRGELTEPESPGAVAEIMEKAKAEQERGGTLFIPIDSSHLSG